MISIIKVKRIGFLFLFLLMTFVTSCGLKIIPKDNITTKVYNYPVLKDKDNNPVLRIQIENDEDMKTVDAIQINVGETNLNNLKNIRVYYTKKDSIFKTETDYGSSKELSKKVKITGNQALEKGTNYFWITYDLSDTVDLNALVYVGIDYVNIDDKKYKSVSDKANIPLRLGVAVRKRMDDNVNTYRIPGMTTTKNGTLLAVYDARRDSARDLQGDMDIGVSRSTDGGNTWQPMQIAMDMGEWGNLPQKFNGVSDANILVDDNTGTIFIAALWMHGVINADGVWQENLTLESNAWNHQWATKGSQPGLGVKQTTQLLITKSTDDGITWSDPINLTEMCKNPKWWLWAPAPGHGITLKDGTLVIPTQGRDENGLPFSNITYSKDGGETWKTSNPASHNTTECMAVELSNGEIMLNIRDNRNAKNKSETNGRAIMTTADLGETWSEHPTSHGALIEPTCMASIHRHDYKNGNGETKSILVFSNPNSKYKRIKQTIKVSFDDGKTWPEKYWIELDEGQGAGYSCITSIDNDNIGVLYEGSQAQMTFQRINLKELIKEYE